MLNPYIAVFLFSLYLKLKTKKKLHASPASTSKWFSNCLRTYRSTSILLKAYRLKTLQGNTILLHKGKTVFFPTPLASVCATSVQKGIGVKIT